VAEDAEVATTAEAVLFLGRCLSYNDAPSAITTLRGRLATARIDWLTVVDTANDHGVTPALWLALNRKALGASLPADLQAYLAMILDLNRQRNRMIRAQTTEAVATLNRRGIRPVLLKGGLSLFEDGIDDGLHLMSDVDLLLQESDLATGVTALRSIGYAMLSDPSRHAHAWAFHRPMSLVSIDLHRHIGPQRNLLAPATAARAAVYLSRHGVEMAGLCPTHRALLLMMNFGIFERHYRNGHIPLRGLHDLAFLSARHGQEIDWTAIAHAARAHMFGASAQALLHMAHHIIGVSLPPALNGTAATLHLRRCLLQLTLPPLERTAHWWTCLAWPFDRFRMDYRYGCGVRGFALSAARFRHAVGILARHNPVTVRRRSATFARTPAAQADGHDLG
jgi:hypothetical protein